MPLIVFLSSSISPWTSTETFLLRSPSATAPMTRRISLLGRTRSSIRLLTASRQPAHTWSVPWKETRWESLPSLPTTRLTRSSSAPSAWLEARTSLRLSATLPATPVQCSGMRAEKSPARAWARTLNSTSALTVLRRPDCLDDIGTLSAVLRVTTAGDAGSVLPGIDSPASELERAGPQARGRDYPQGDAGPPAPRTVRHRDAGAGRD